MMTPMSDLDLDLARIRVVRCHVNDRCVRGRFTHMTYRVMFGANLVQL